MANKFKQKRKNIFILSEDSSGGYLDEIKSFYAGFVLMAEYCFKRGLDVKISKKAKKIYFR